MENRAIWLHCRKGVSGQELKFGRVKMGSFGSQMGTMLPGTVSVRKQ